MLLKFVVVVVVVVVVIVVIRTIFFQGGTTDSSSSSSRDSNFFIISRFLDFSIFPIFRFLIHQNSKNKKTVGLMKVHVGSCTIQGRRPHNEDRILISHSNPSLFAVFDGHGGSFVSAMLKDRLLPVFRKHMAKDYPDVKTVSKALTSTIRDLEDLSLAASMKKSGSTLCVCVLVEGTKIVCANVGDSRAVAFAGGKVIALSSDHSLEDPIEKARCIRNGGVVFKKYGQLRVSSRGMSLNLSRALGDVLMKRPSCVISPHPDIRVVDMMDNKAKIFTIVIGSDGVFGRLSSKDVGRFLRMKFCKTGGDCKEVSKLLVDHAYDKGSWDNISAVVIRVELAGESK